MIKKRPRRLGGFVLTLTLVYTCVGAQTPSQPSMTLEQAVAGALSNYAQIRAARPRAEAANAVIEITR